MTDHKNEIDASTDPTTSEDPPVFDFRSFMHDTWVKQEIKRQAREDAWFQRLHDTIRAATEEGTLAALQRHDGRFPGTPSKVEYNIEPGGE
jgi:hypothetical protein